MQIAHFDPAGGRIQAGVSCSPNRNGSYTIKLWEANANQVVKEFAGNFINTDDDRYFLDAPNAQHQGRLIEGLVVVAVPPGVGPSTVMLTVSQDGRTLATDAAAVPPASPGQFSDLFIALEAG